LDSGKCGIALCYVSTDGKGIQRSVGKIGQDIKTEIVKSVHVFARCMKYTLVTAFSYTENRAVWQPFGPRVAG
jgi:hypothetical protein